MAQFSAGGSYLLVQVKRLAGKSHFVSSGMWNF